jgi:GH24 family phage-related lysozyme (muramidase)
MEPLGALSGAAGGMADAVAGIIEQRLRQAQVANQVADAQARLAETERANKATEAYRTSALAQTTAWQNAQDAENKRYHDQLNADRLSKEGQALNESMPPGTDFSPSDPMAKYLTATDKPSYAEAPPAALAADPTQQGPVPLPGTIANAPSPVAGRLLTKTPTFRQIDTMTDNARQAAAALAAANKPKEFKLSPQGAAVNTSLEQAGPMTDQVLAALREQYPGIDTNPDQYNTLSAKGKALAAQTMYNLGFSSPDEARMAIEKLLQPIQAGQYMRSSRSQQMLQLALSHMGDPGQTPAAQYNRLKTLRGLMPEMKEGLYRAEQKIDPNDPYAGSYFQHELAGAGGGAPDTAQTGKTTTGVATPGASPGATPATGKMKVYDQRGNLISGNPNEGSSAVPAASAAPTIPDQGTNPSRAESAAAPATPPPPPIPTIATMRPGQMRVAPDFLPELQRREGGFYAEPYDDSGTGGAIGYGMHSWQGKPVAPDLRITQEQADAEMQRQIAQEYAPRVDRALKVPVTQDQYNALISVAWNSPRAADALIAKLNAHQPLSEQDFQQTATIKGTPNKGLSQRRQLEAAPFLNP